jgi:hypothetical protein
MLCILPGIAAGESYPEHEVKAAFLYNFMRFTDWPAEKLGDANAPMRIFVVGKYPPCKTFKDIQKKNGDEKPVEVRIFESYKEIKEPNMLQSSHILFITKSERKHTKEILDVAKNNNILTVGENDDFLKIGGIINFVKQDEKMRFEVNMPAANKADIKIRSKLLRLAKRVITEEEN